MSLSNSSKLHNEYFLEYSQHKKSSCETCGYNGGDRRDENGWLITRARIKLTVHHLDGNVRNNVPENLQTLCRPCHDKVHYNL